MGLEKKFTPPLVDIFLVISNTFFIFVMQNSGMNSLEHRFMMNRLGRRLYHCLMFYAR